MTHAAPQPTRPWLPELTATAAAWTVVAVVAIGLRILALAASDGHVRVTTATMDVWIIGQWALVTPLVLRSARRFPVQSPTVRRHAFVHLTIGSAFIVVSNIVIRLPMLWNRQQGVMALARGTAAGLATYYPTAIILYCALVALGHRLFPSATADVPREDEEQPDASQLVIREWNRVHFISLDDVEWIEAANNHVVVHTAAKTYKGRERMSDVEARLDPRRFVRVHRSAIVHRSRIREVQPLMHGDQAVILRSGRVVRVARSRRRALEEALGI